MERAYKSYQQKALDRSIEINYSIEVKETRLALIALSHDSGRQGRSREGTTGWTSPQTNSVEARSKHFNNSR